VCAGAGIFYFFSPGIPRYFTKKKKKTTRVFVRKSVRGTVTPRQYYRRIRHYYARVVFIGRAGVERLKNKKNSIQNGSTAERPAYVFFIHPSEIDACLVKIARLSTGKANIANKRVVPVTTAYYRNCLNGPIASAILRRSIRSKRDRPER